MLQFGGKHAKTTLTKSIKSTKDNSQQICLQQIILNRFDFLNLTEFSGLSDLILVLNHFRFRAGSGLELVGPFTTLE